MSYAVIRFLAETGWRTAGHFDLCWLDCDKPGYLRVAGSRAICLCESHAYVLQTGCWQGDYAGAPLPPESRADEWPWQKLSMQASAA